MNTHNGSARTTSKTRQQMPPVSDATRRIVLGGVVFALLCAEAWSAPALFKIAVMAKAPASLAWLLPAVIDGYAVTAIIFGNNIPRDHPRRAEVIGNTRLALAITVTANGVYHLLALAANKIPTGVEITLLITVTALPVYIADRLVHLYRLAASGGPTELLSAPADTGTADQAPTAIADRHAPVGADRTRTAPADSHRAADRVPTPTARPVPTSAPAAADEPPTADAAPTAPPVPTSAPAAADHAPTAADAAPTAGKPRTADVGADSGATVYDWSTAGAAVRRNTAQWALDVLPIYRHLSETTGTTPTAPVLAEAIKHAGMGELGPSRARDIRKATAELHDLVARALPSYRRLLLSTGVPPTAAALIEAIGGSRYGLPEPSGSLAGDVHKATQELYRHLHDLAEDGSDTAAAR